MYAPDWEGEVRKKENVLVMFLSFLAIKLGTIVIYYFDVKPVGLNNVCLLYTSRCV